MRRRWSFVLAVAASVGSSVLVIAQPPGGPGGPGAGGPGARGPGGGLGERRPNPLIEALDTDHDHTISADEIKAASAALLTLDMNKDGQLSSDEYRPAGAGGPGGPGAGGPGAGGPGASGPGAGGPGPGGPGTGGPGAGGPGAGGPAPSDCSATGFRIAGR